MRNTQLKQKHVDPWRSQNKNDDFGVIVSLFYITTRHTVITTELFSWESC